MPAIKFTDLTIKALSAPHSGRIEYSDARWRGLVLRVTSKGTKSWAVRYRDNSGRTLRLTLGEYPGLGLAEARHRAQEKLTDVRAGRSPAQEKRDRRDNAERLSFQHLADRYLDEHARRFKRSAAADERNLGLHVLPRWRYRAFAEIKRRDVAEVLETAVRQGKPILANRLRALLSKVFRFAVSKGLLEVNPASGLDRPSIEVARDRVLDDDELRLFWHGTHRSPLSVATGLALRLVLLTGQRPGEVTGMSTAELKDLDQPGRAIWVLPAARAKNRREHVIPLNPTTVGLIKVALSLSGGSEFVFPSPRRPGRKELPMTAHALAVALSRFSKAIAPNGPKPHPSGDMAGAVSWRRDPPHPHDLRRTCATRLRGLGVATGDIEAVLNHKGTSVLARHYDKHDGLREKRSALTSWAGALDAILVQHDSPAGSVIHLHCRSSDVGSEGDTHVPSSAADGPGSDPCS